MIYFTIPGEPQGKARARTGKGFAYTPEKTVLYENLIKTMFMQSKRPPIEGNDKAIQMRIKAHYGVPKSDSKPIRNAKLCHEIRPTKKPDIDNLCKVVADALNGLAYHDDTQIVNVEVSKWYSENPRVEVWILEL